MGERLVAIKQGVSASAIAPGDTLPGEFLMGLSEVMGSAGNVLDEVEITTRNLREISDALIADGKLREGVDDFAATSKSLRGMTEDNRVRLDRAIEKFDRAATQLDRLLTDHYAELDSSLAALGRAGGKVDVTVDNLAVVSQDLKEITAKLRTAEGSSAGRLINDDTLIRRLEASSAELDSLLEDIRKNPGRYVKFSLF
jgi:phospholipid/cholesterol/gamma-HCH transport system substrate-binding protein